MHKRIRGNAQVITDVTNAARFAGSISAPEHDADVIRTMTDSSPAALRAQFIEEARAVGMSVNRIQRTSLIDEIDSILHAAAAGPVLLEPAMASDFPELLSLPRVRTEPTEEETFGAPIGIVSAAAGIAETGSIVRFTSNDSPRSTALVPWTLVVVLEADRLVPDLYDWIGGLDPKSMASEIVLITGPSKSADIGMQLVTGVHGPGEVRILLLADDCPRIDRPAARNVPIDSA